MFCFPARISYILQPLFNERGSVSYPKQNLVGIGYSRKEVGNLPPSVDGEHDRERVREVGGSVEESLALVKSFSHELVLLVVEFKDGLLKVSDTSVHEFR